MSVLPGGSGRLGPQRRRLRARRAAAALPSGPPSTAARAGREPRRGDTCAAEVKEGAAWPRAGPALT